MHVRRDAATSLPNGRVIYDALFSRVGIQTYGSSVEYRPPDEVGAARSLASGSLCPGVLLHPSDNYGTDFGPGSYPVRGTTGETIVMHADGIHTAGKLIVWDDEWNSLIDSDEISELSVGYTIVPDPTPGVAPDGTKYQVVHREIIWDHVAGVQAGNAGSARVMTDARGARADKKILAEIAAARMDARPLYFDLGSWVTTPRKDDDMNAAKLLKALTEKLDGKHLDAGAVKRIADAWVDINGDSNHPAMQQALASFGELAAPATAAVPAAGRADGLLTDLLADLEQIVSDLPDEAKAVVEAVIAKLSEAAEAAAPTETGEGEGGEAEMQDAKPKSLRELVADQVAVAVAAERSKIHDAAELRLDERAEVLTVARSVFGADYSPRKDGRPVPTAQIMREVVGKHDAARLGKIDKRFAAGPKRDAAIESEFDRVRESIADSRDYGDQLAEAINATRMDNLAERNDAISDLSKALKKQDQDARLARGPGSPAPQ